MNEMDCPREMRLVEYDQQMCQPIFEDAPNGSMPFSSSVKPATGIPRGKKQMGDQPKRKRKRYPSASIDYHKTIPGVPGKIRIPPELQEPFKQLRVALAEPNMAGVLRWLFAAAKDKIDDLLGEGAHVSEQDITQELGTPTTRGCPLGNGDTDEPNLTDVDMESNVVEALGEGVNQQQQRADDTRIWIPHSRTADDF